ncbi:hypothetical protein EV188_10278 [Actinomycetospora succinea]|uniref:Uncharacterized protein n=1 Tax=Actinomycetospora succinea TaxID=663603 RepID=A0A4R6VHB2_9PSEU|nr:hypothetical protein EV188_10278 [Actinomycetospora succinea]
MTSEGSGSAKSVQRSADDPAARIASISSTAYRVTWSESARMRRTVNCPTSSLRSRVCSGGSIMMKMPWPGPSPTGVLT